GENLVNAPLDDPGIVVARIESARRELEPFLALDTAVAGRGVAAPLGEDAADVSREAEGGRCSRAFDPHVGLGRLVFASGFQVQLSTRQGCEPAGLVERCPLRIGDRKTTAAGEVA